MTIPDPLNDASTETIISDRKQQRYLKWKIARERTTVQGIAISIALLRGGKFKTIDQLAVAMGLTVPQVRWRLQKGRERGLISEGCYRSFAEPSEVALIKLGTHIAIDAD